MPQHPLRSLVCLCLLLAGGLVWPLESWAQNRLRPRPLAPRGGQSSSAAARAPAKLAQRQLTEILPADGIAHYHTAPTELLAFLQQAIDHQRQFPDTAENRSPWGVMHTTLAWGSDGDVLIEGQPYNAIQALCDNQKLKGVQLLSAPKGQLKPLEGPGLQGHPGQFLAILAQNQVPIDQPLRVGEHTFTVADLVAFEQKTCRPNMELTFKLIGLSHYLPSDEIWQSDDGGTWSLERLLRLELRQPINGRQTCGGTHRLMGIYLAVERRRQQELEIDAAWAAAEKYTDDYHAYAFSLFNPDGSFSTEWLERRAALDDPQRRVQTSGHVLEWLAVSLPDSQLQDPTLLGGFAYLAGLLQTDIGESWAVGPRAHALRALRLYQARLSAQLSGSPEVAPPIVASEPPPADPATAR